jgi:putative lipoic acid-binding regulatory protein
MCESKESIVGYIYDDLAGSERRTFEAHMAVCRDCRDEVTALRATRVHLSLWSPPARDLGFKVVRDDAAAAPARVLPMRKRWTAAFGLAAAAVLVLAAATAIANLEIRYDANGLVVRTGWARPAAETAQAPAPASAAVPASTRDGVAELEVRLAQLERTLAATPAGSIQVTSGPRMADVEILRRVREMVSQAETRQQAAVTNRLVQVVQDFDRQRQTDLATIQRGLGTYQGLTNAEIATQRDMLNQLYRVAARQEK